MGLFFFFKELQNWDVFVEQNAVPKYTEEKGRAGSSAGLRYCVCPSSGAWGRGYLLPVRMYRPTAFSANLCSF